MKFVVQNHSSYPPNERGSLTIDELIEDQESAGADIVTDGMINWPDPLTAALYSVGGLKPDLVIQYESYPVLLPRVRQTGPLQYATKFALHDFVEAKQVATRPLKALVAGPYSLARIVAADQPQDPLPALAEAWSAVISAEVMALAEAGATLIQIHEPLLGKHPEDIRLARTVLEPVWAARGSAVVAIALPYGNAEPVYAELNSLPTDMLVLDVASSPGLMELIAATGTSKILALGIAHPRAEQVESVDELCGRIEPLLRRYAMDEMHLCQGAGLMFSTRERANQTLQRLRQTADQLNGRTNT